MNSKDEYNPSKGVKEDFSTLLGKFSDLESVRFELFANVWKSMKLSLLGAGRVNERERREFFEEVTLIALSFYLPPYNFQVRVGGLYTLYSLYITQPCLPKVPIRVTFDQWKQILEFQDSMTHLDASYIFHKLFSFKAFQFVATPQEVYLKVKDKSKDGSSEMMNANLNVVADTVNNVFTSDILLQLRAIHTQYHHLKLGIAGPHAVRPDRSLDVISSDVMDRIQGCIDDHRTRHDNIISLQKHRQSKRKKNTSDSEDETDEQEDSDFSPSKLASVKSQAFANKAKQSRSRRHRILVTQDASGSSPEKMTKKSQNMKGMSSASSQEDEPVWRAPSVTEPEETVTVLRGEGEEYLSMPTLDGGAGPSFTTDNVDDIELKSPTSEEKEDISPPNPSIVDKPMPKQSKTSASKGSKKTKSAKGGKSAKSTAKKKAKVLKVKISPVKKTSPKKKGQTSVSKLSKDLLIKAEGSDKEHA